MGRGRRGLEEIAGDPVEPAVHHGVGPALFAVFVGIVVAQSRDRGL